MGALVNVTAIIIIILSVCFVALLACFVELRFQIILSALAVSLRDAAQGPMRQTVAEH